MSPQWSATKLFHMSQAAKVVVRACLLVDGSSVYLRANETWTHDMQEAEVLDWSEGEFRVSEREKDAQPLVFAPDIVEAELREGVVVLFGLTCG